MCSSDLVEIVQRLITAALLPAHCAAIIPGGGEVGFDFQRLVEIGQRAVEITPGSARHASLKMRGGKLRIEAEGEGVIADGALQFAFGIPFVAPVKVRRRRHCPRGLRLNDYRRDREQEQASHQSFEVAFHVLRLSVGWRGRANDACAIAPVVYLPQTAVRD